METIFESHMKKPYSDGKYSLEMAIVVLRKLSAVRSISS